MLHDNNEGLYENVNGLYECECFKRVTNFKNETISRDSLSPGERLEENKETKQQLGYSYDSCLIYRLFLIGSLIGHML